MGGGAHERGVLDGGVFPMSRASRARRIATAAAYGGGGLGVAGVLATGVLIGEAKLARWAIRTPDGPPPGCDGRYGEEFGGEPIRMVLLGDSSAAGTGVELPRQTPGALFARGLAEAARRPVDLRCFAVVGAMTSEIGPQVESALALRPEIAVLLVGANDVTHMVRPQVSVQHLDKAVRALRAGGSQVVLGTCPDLGTIRPIRQPLRWMCRRWSRQLAAAQTVAAVRAGARTVSLGDLLGPEFEAAPAELFSDDHFHPSPAGYAKAAAAVLPTVAATLGLVHDAAPAMAGGGVRSLPRAAVAAVDRAGTEVSGVPAEAAHPLAPAGRWAQLRQRVRMLAARPTGPQRTGTMQTEALNEA